MGNRFRQALLLAVPSLLALAAIALLSASASAAPTVSIVTPSEGATINSGTITLTLDIQNFTLNGSAVGQPPVAGEGHFHIMLDGVYQRYDYSVDSFLADVPQGPHMVTVELANNDHSLLGINDSVNVTISTGAPRLRILSPASSTAWGSSSVELQIWKENFTYNASAVGQAAVAGEGHYHVYLNGAYFYLDTSDFFNVTYLNIGVENTIRVELANNDHTLLADRVFDQIRLTPSAGVPELKLDASLFNAVVNASSLEASLTVSNFTIDPNAIGQAAVAGHGHYHVWLDGVLLGPSAASTVMLTDLSVGPHMLVVELRNNDHTTLSPRVVDWEPFTVPVGAPRVTITSPADPSTINASSAEIAFTVGNFTIDGSLVGQANVVGVGHWHVYVDGVYIAYGSDLEAYVSDLSQGPHVISIELHNNDHSDLTWPAFDTVRVVVPAGAPTVTITSPAAASTLNSSSVALSFTIANFTLNAAAVGQPPVAGEGHWHLLIDDVYQRYGTELTANAMRLAPGTHTIKIELYNNDHTELTWAPFDQVTVTVPPGAPWIAITDPAASASLGFTFAPVVVEVQNFSIVSKAGLPAVTGEGHWHLSVDGAYKDMFFGLAGMASALTPGKHTIRAELVNNDHTSLAAPAFDEVEVTVVGAVPSVAIVTPAPAFTTTDTTVMVTVNVANFTLDPVGTTPNVAGHGHLHVYVDGNLSQMVATTQITVANLTVGTHTIRIELANNDHSAVPGGGNVSQVTVTVNAVAAPPPAKGFLPGFGVAETLAAVSAMAVVVALARRKRQ